MPKIGTQAARNSSLLRIRCSSVLNRILADDYQIDVNVEDPPLDCPDDVIDIRSTGKHSFAPDHRYFPKGGAFEVRFSVDRDRRTLAIAGQDKNCRLVPITPLLDRKISLTGRGQGIYDVVCAFESALSAKASAPVSLITTPG